MTASPEAVTNGSQKRDEVIRRFESKCYLCDTLLEPSQIILDHIIPRSRGGTNASFNLAAACIPCDQRKADYLLSELDWISPEVRSKFATLKREREQNKKRHWTFAKRLRLAVIALVLTPANRLDSLIDTAKK